MSKSIPEVNSSKFSKNEKKSLLKIVGMAYDNFTESVIIRSNFFMQYLKQEVPGLVMLNCICHSFTLVAKKACEKLPLSCEKFD